MHRGDEVTNAVFQRPGRYLQVADNLRVKAVVVGAGERRRRYVVCPNPQEEKRPRAHRQQVLRELEAELASLRDVRGESQSKRVCQLRASRRYGRYRRMTKSRLLRIDTAKRRSEAQLDGKFVVHSNDDSLSPADLALGYKQHQRVEEAWRTLKLLFVLSCGRPGRRLSRGDFAVLVSAFAWLMAFSASLRTTGSLRSGQECRFCTLTRDTVKQDHPGAGLRHTRSRRNDRGHGCTGPLW